jgi:hypothetical protein
MNESSIEQMELTNSSTFIFGETKDRVLETQKSQTLYVWNIVTDTFDYVICDADDARPEIVSEPFLFKTLHVKDITK